LNRIESFEVGVVDISFVLGRSFAHFDFFFCPLSDFLRLLPQ